MAIYRFKISFEDYDDVVRIIDIKTAQSFEDLHKAIHRSTGYDVEKSSSFYISSDNWIKGDEIAYLPSERKLSRGVTIMQNAKIKSFIEDPHQKFYYTYDFDRPFDFHVQLTDIILKEDTQIEYPFLVKSFGEAPKIINRNADVIAPAEKENENEFDFINEMNFEASDDEEIEALGDLGVNTDNQEQEEEKEDEEDEFGNEFSDNENYEDEDNY